MKAMSKLWVTLIREVKAWAVLATFVAASFLAFGTANAVALSNTEVSWRDFAGTWRPTNIQPLVTDLPIGATFPYVRTVSVAYKSQGGATEGKWVYAYQIILYSHFSDIPKEITSFSVLTFAPPETVKQDGTTFSSFYTLKPLLAKPTEFPEFSREDPIHPGARPTSATYDYNARTKVGTISWEITLRSSLLFDLQSVIFGYVSAGPPKKASASLVMTFLRTPPERPERKIYLPKVWVASPEPASALLLGIGLLGIGMFRRRKR